MAGREIAWPAEGGAPESVPPRTAFGALLFV